MADRYELAYVYARVCGSLASSLAAGRAAELLRIGRLGEAWRAVFRDAPPSLPESALVAAAEARAVTEALDGFRSLAGKLRGEEPFFIALRRKTEYARVKRVLLAAKEGDFACPPSLDPSLPPSFDETGFPSLERMFAGGRFFWIGPTTLAALPAAENRLDRQFYAELWAALDSVPRRRRGCLRDLLLLEVELENSVWALRLSRYYGLGLEAISALLVELPGADATAAALDGAARAGARAELSERKADRRADWEGWKFERLLDGGGEPWRLDARGIEAAARHLLYRRCRLALHRFPFTYVPLYCYFKLKEFETAVALGLFEGIYLGAPAEEIAALAPAGGTA